MTKRNRRHLRILGLLLVAALIGGTPSFAEEDEAPVKKIKMYARNWDWTPDQIRVKVGTRVIIDFVSEDASHAFHLKAYKIKVNLPQDSKARVEFVADKVGEFPWRCSRPCGNGCAKMRGTLTVAE